MANFKSQYKKRMQKLIATLKVHFRKYSVVDQIMSVSIRYHFLFYNSFIFVIIIIIKLHQNKTQKNRKLK